MTEKKSGVAFPVFIFTIVFLSILTVTLSVITYFLGRSEVGNRISISNAIVEEENTSAVINDEEKYIQFKLMKIHLPLKPWFISNENSTGNLVDDLKYEGNATVTMQCLKNGTKFVLNSGQYRINLKNESLMFFDITNGTNVQLDDSAYNIEQNGENIVLVFIKNDLVQKHTYQLNFGYTGEMINADLIGFYPGSYIENGSVILMPIPSFESKDTDREDIVVEVEVLVPENMTVLGNGAVIDESDLGNDWNIIRMDLTGRISPSFVAFGIFTINIGNDGITGRYETTPTPPCDKPNQVYMTCGPACEPTYDSPYPAGCNEQCKEGCFCEEGLVKDIQGNCIPFDNCSEISTTEHIESTLDSLTSPIQIDFTTLIDTSTITATSPDMETQPTSTETPPDHTKCGKNERWSWSHCVKPVECQYPQCPNVLWAFCFGQCSDGGCVCKKGYFRNKCGRCVKWHQCKKAKCDDTEESSSGNKSSDEK